MPFISTTVGHIVVAHHYWCDEIYTQSVLSAAAGTADGCTVEPLGPEFSAVSGPVSNIPVKPPGPGFPAVVESTVDIPVESLGPVTPAATAKGATEIPAEPSGTSRQVCRASSPAK